MLPTRAGLEISRSGFLLGQKSGLADLFRHREAVPLKERRVYPMLVYITMI
jgi:hypothetical protein